VTLRLALGVLVGSVLDERTGTFSGITGGVVAAQRSGASYFYVGPEALVGQKVGDHFAIAVGAQVMLAAALHSPTWNGASPVVVTAPSGGATARQQDATLPNATLAGAFILIASPEIAIAYEF
jgi:hypothetical protein